MLSNLNNLKIDFIREEIRTLEEMILSAERSIKESQEEANYHIGAMQSRYDTFKEEAQYLVDAHKIRVLNLKEQLMLYYKTIENIEKNITSNCLMLGSICTLSNEVDDTYFFILPISSKNDFIYKNKKYKSVSINAPIIIPFINKKVNYDCDIDNHQLEEFHIKDVL